MTSSSRSRIKGSDHEGGGSARPTAEDFARARAALVWRTARSRSLRASTNVCRCIPPNNMLLMSWRAASPSANMYGARCGAMSVISRLHRAPLYQPRPAPRISRRPARHSGDQTAARAARRCGLARQSFAVHRTQSPGPRHRASERASRHSDRSRWAAPVATGACASRVAHRPAHGGRSHRYGDGRPRFARALAESGLAGAMRFFNGCAPLRSDPERLVAAAHGLARALKPSVRTSARSIPRSQLHSPRYGYNGSPDRHSELPARSCGQIDLRAPACTRRSGKAIGQQVVL